VLTCLRQAAANIRLPAASAASCWTRTASRNRSTRGILAQAKAKVVAAYDWVGDGQAPPPGDRVVEPVPIGRGPHRRRSAVAAA
jgi:hypothetical protein